MSVLGSQVEGVILLSLRLDHQILSRNLFTNSFDRIWWMEKRIIFQNKIHFWKFWLKGNMKNDFRAELKNPSFFSLITLRCLCQVTYSSCFCGLSNWRKGLGEGSWKFQSWINLKWLSQLSKIWEIKNCIKACSIVKLDILGIISEMPNVFAISWERLLAWSGYEMQTMMTKKNKFPHSEWLK